jgi:hypothetical protein
MAVLLGSLHFLIVGIPFIHAGGGGEGLLYIILVDYPLFRLAYSIARVPLYNSVAFNFWWFPVLGTIMYAAVGYLLGVVFILVKMMLRGLTRSLHSTPR